jgi:hypothetical protein
MSNLLYSPVTGKSGKRFLVTTEWFDKGLTVGRSRYKLIEAVGNKALYFFNWGTLEAYLERV